MNSKKFLPIFLLLFLIGCSQPKLFKETKILMDTFCEISCYSSDKDSIKDAFKEIERIERLCNRFDEQSELSRVNAIAGRKEVVISKELFELITRSIYYSEISSGAFDVTKKGKYKSIILDKDRLSIHFTDSDIGIDLGGIAKGYAVDRAIQILRSYDIENALVNLGGNMYALGSSPGKDIWRIGIRNPKRKSAIIHKLDLKDRAVSTSGGYERTFHIIDPSTGKPASKVLSVTVVSDSAETSDALSTAIFVMGIEDGLKLAGSLNGIEVYILTLDTKLTKFP